MRKSIIAIVVAAVSVSSFAASANTASPTLDLFNAVVSHQVSFSEFKTSYQAFTKPQQDLFKRLEKANGKNFTSDIRCNKASAGGYVAHNNPEGTPVTMVSGTKNDPTGTPVTMSAGTKTNSAGEPVTMISGVKNDPTGKPGEFHSNGVDGKDGQKGETGAEGKAGANGSNGKDGKDGVTTVRRELDTETKAVVISHSRAISNNSAAIERNSQRIDRNAKDIQENRKAIKQVGAMATASANLHYNRAENGYAVAVGEYKGATAVAGGVQFNTSENTAVTVQASYDGDAVGASVGFHGSW